MEFAERMFLLINGLPVPEEPAQHLRSDEPGPMQKFIEKMQFDHAMGKRPVAGEDYEIPELMSKLLAPRDSRDLGEPITPRSGGDLAKRFPGHDGEGRKVARTERQHYSAGDVIAEFDEANHVIRTYFEPAV